MAAGPDQLLTGPGPAARVEHARLLFETTIQGVVFQDAGGRIVDANPAAERILGLTLAQMQGRTSVDPRWKATREDGSDFPGEDHPAAVALRTGRPVRDVVMAVFDPSAGLSRWIRVNAIPLFHTGGDRPFEVCTSFEEITSARQAESDLGALASRLSLALESAKAGWWEWDLGTGTNRWSPELFRLYDLDPAEVAPSYDAWRSAIHPDDLARVEAHVLETSAREGELAVEWKVRTRDGSERCLVSRGRPQRDREGRATHYLGVVLDITEPHLAEEAARASESRYRDLFSHMGEGVAYCRMTFRDGAAVDWVYLLVNEAFGEKTGLGNVSGRWVSEVIPGLREANPELFETYGRVARAGRPERFESYLPALGRWFSVSAFSPAPEHFVAVFDDISDRKRAEAALATEREGLARRVMERTADLSRANADLARAARAKDEFLANMSHELRTPLNAVLGLSESLLEQRAGPLTERQQAMVAAVEQSGRHLLDLINDILDLSRVEAGRLELAPGPVMVADVCQASLQMVREAAIRKGLRLEARCPDQLARVHADERRLTQILVNLLTNAVKFTPERGTVTLEAVADGETESVRFSVSDTGIGIAEAELPRLFQPFSQVDSSLTRTQEGSGLGLALVHRLAELHGGSVAVDSVPDQGSRFTVVLPASHATPSPERGRRTTPRTALVVDDSRASADQLSRLLRALEVEATVHLGGQGVVEAVRTLRPDVVLLDILMPDRSGWEVLADLRADPETSKVPVVVCSVVDEPAGERAARPDAHLVKPVEREALERALRAVAESVEQALVVVPHEAPRGPRLLLAEDNEVNVLTVQGFLEDEGYEVAVARNGREAVDLASALRPALVLMDVQMPEVDGLEATRRLRRTPGFEGTPIVALTALAMPGDRERCLAAGADEYLTKPVPLRKLAEVVARFLPSVDGVPGPSRQDETGPAGGPR